jgi:hypothetical protein
MGRRDNVRLVRDLLLLAIHLLVTLAKLVRPGGVRALAAESLLLKHQLVISHRRRQRAPNLTTLDRFVLGLITQFVSPRRIPTLSVILRPATLFKFHKALVDRKYADLRVLEIEEIKSVPYVPVSHPFVERLIRTIRREYLDHMLFWNAPDLTRKLDAFRCYYNEQRVHRSLDGTTPALRAGASAPAPAALDRNGRRQHCSGLFQIPVAA